MRQPPPSPARYPGRRAGNRRVGAHRARGAATLEKGIATRELRSDLDVEDALDVIFGPLWLRLLVGHRPLNQAAADQLLTLVWPGLENVNRPAEGPTEPLPSKNQRYVAGPHRDDD